MGICKYISCLNLCNNKLDDSLVEVVSEKDNVQENIEENNKQKYGRPASLQNIGANCYLNSALQGISSCDGFVDDLDAKYKELCSLNEKGLEKMKVLNNLIRRLNGKDESGDSGLEISSNSIFEEWNKPGQQDSFELLSYMINQVFNEIRQFMEENSKIKKNDVNDWIKTPLPLRINIGYEMKCNCKAKISTPQQTDLALHISITKTNDVTELLDLLEAFFKPDQISGYKCDTNGCDGKEASKRPRLIPELPKTLCIHLQRSHWTGSLMEKTNNEVKFSEELKIKPEYMSGNNGNDSGILNESYNHDDDDADSKNRYNTIYTLTAVIVHVGSVQVGHYVCYRRSKEKWYKTNDSIISESSWDEVMKVQAYILFYEKKNN